MKHLKKTSFTLALILLISCVPGGGNYNDGPSELKIANEFSNGMMLQSGVEIPVFGTAYKTTVVMVSFNKEKIKAITDNNGDWIVNIPIQKVGGPYELKISVNDTTIVLRDIEVR